jgi:Tfp pilus assembly PilM family ATPase
MSERLPLGIDLGESRVRVAALARKGSAVRLIGIGCADVVGTVEEALAAALRELGSGHAKAVTMIRACEARLRSTRFPAISSRETRRATYFEGVASFGDQPEPIAVRSMALRHDCGEERMLIAAARVATVQRAATILKSARLSAVRIDHEGCVLARTGQLPLLDIGLRRSTLVVLSGGIPVVRTIPLGGLDFTNALANELGTDVETAEIRKRTIGLGGAGSAALQAFCASIAGEFRALREDEGLHANRLRLSGNGARLPDLMPALEHLLGLEISPVTLDELLVADLPPHVVNTAALDSFSAVAAALPDGSLTRLAA